MPFFIGLIIGPVGWYIRTRLPDAPVTQQSGDINGSPLREVLARYPTQTLASGALIVPFHGLHLRHSRLHACLCGADAEAGIV